MVFDCYTRIYDLEIEREKKVQRGRETGEKKAQREREREREKGTT